MTVAEWVGAERFYEFWFIFLSITFFISLIALIFVGSYTTKENRKKFLLIVTSFSVLVLSIGLFGHAKYHSYLEQASLINALVRDRQPRLNTYVYYGASEKNYYIDLNDLDSLRQLEMYQEKQIIEPITYLGEDKYFHYFERSDGKLFKKNRDIYFQDDINTAQLVGSQFELMDDDFKQIGFFNPNRIMFDYIGIPKTQEGIIFEPEDNSKIPTAETGIRHWNF